MKEEIKSVQLNLQVNHESDLIEDDTDNNEEPQSIFDILQSKYLILTDIVENVLNEKKILQKKQYF